VAPLVMGPQHDQQKKDRVGILSLPCICTLVHPRFLNARAMQMHTQQVTFVDTNVLSKIKKNCFKIERSKKSRQGHEYKE
jgi:hypothetical protein